MHLPFYIVDTFTQTQFSGNPAAVCPLKKWLPDQILINIAAENNYAETAFFIPRKHHINLRWFTPRMEVELCGHATLATAFVLKSVLGENQNTFSFKTLSGEHKVTCEDGLYSMNFPAYNLEPLDLAAQVSQCIGVPAITVTRAANTWIAELQNEAHVNNAVPDFSRITKLECQGLIVTAAGEKSDFVSRFFAPRIGINEDSVTGSAHCGLIPYWHRKLGKQRMLAHQNSLRGGVIHCEYRGERVIVAGYAVLYCKGRIHLGK